MKLQELLSEIDRLKTEVDGLLPMKKEFENKLMQKFRLDWNYNSNHIEGNTLTYGETELLLIFEKTTGDHDKREYDEMQAHDVAIKMVYDLALDKERPLTETFIKQLNEVILVKPFWKEAVTPDGQNTRRLIKVGDYKEHPNSVRLANGEMFNYASPQETPILMGELMSFYKPHESDSEMHSLLLAASMHYKFVRIHPFDDGNGRVSRLLMNYVLIKKGFPPVIIKSSDKKNYLNALNKADTGDLESFIIYIGEQLLWSLNISIKAAKGEDISEDGDIDKEIALFKASLPKENRIKTGKTRESVKFFFKNVFDPLLQKLVPRLEQFDELFHENSIDLILNNANDRVNKKDLPSKIDFFILNCDVDLNGLVFNYSWRGYNKPIKTAFDIHLTIQVQLKPFEYEISCNYFKKKLINNPYGTTLTNNETEKIISKLVKTLMEVISHTIENINQ